MFYLVKTPWWLKRAFPSYTWQLKTSEKIIYLTFDDGPCEEVTPFVLRQLREHGALATFFCIGKNVVEQRELYRQIISEGHAVGNHTYSHLNGWKTKDEVYMKDVLEASHHIDSNLFRPPYGKITRFQARRLPAVMKGANVKLIMWDVLSGDFDERVSGKKCLENVIFNAGPGSIVVFHDSKKAFPRLQYALPKMLSFFSGRGYSFRSLEGI
jgi:peptidoglycan/xylan/chitin deacetylase (PgdA/CDA1 family)